MILLKNVNMFTFSKARCHKYFVSIWEEGWSAVGAPQGGSAPPRTFSEKN